MNKLIQSIIILLITANCFSQNETLYLKIEKPFFKKINTTSYITGFISKSEDPRFISDYFRFEVFNTVYIEDKNEIGYLTPKELRKKVSIDTLKYVTINELVEQKAFWQVHNELSLKKKIFLLEEVNCTSITAKNSFEYFILPLIYVGTRKNIIPTKG
ncbi:hypothetical protein [Dokdonia sp. Hel_I_53]|uniref:hypothetical protein n=1 Tax=Dokdonia sp. Hel_I_53 TaxID=1566287 RepID=UPI00119BD043|nr:hypothetical protein [Dokdonia sp. Hel_I_53]TVZ52691.1 hypothetical protein OD90_1875 [Dokdonia sp. Hel_I_53]